MPIPAQTRYINATVRIVQRLLHNFQGDIALRLWNGAHYVFGEAVPKFTLVVRDPTVLRKLVLKRNPITLVDAYFRGLVDFEGDLYAGLRLKPYLQKLSLPIRSRAALVMDALLQSQVKRRLRASSMGMIFFSDCRRACSMRKASYSLFSLSDNSFLFAGSMRDRHTPTQREASFTCTVMPAGYPWVILTAV